MGASEEDRWGAQVIALGDGKFRAVGYRGGLPGDGWDRGDERVETEGERRGNVTTFTADHWIAEIRDGKMSVMNDEGRLLIELKKIDRVSSTMGEKAPDGAIVLFDGTSANHFVNAEVTEEKFLKSDCWSKMKFQDHSLHLEFRTPFKPFARGQQRGNSGMYVQSRYEVQVLDSFGLEGADNECGGIYKIQVPAVNMCFPPLSWQTYDYDFKAARYNEGGDKIENARITVRHNGVVIHDNLELPHATPGRETEGPEPGALYLQGHGNPVVYRNIWAVVNE